MQAIQANPLFIPTQSNPNTIHALLSGTVNSNDPNSHQEPNHCEKKVIEITVLSRDEILKSIGEGKIKTCLWETNSEFLER
jgi:hypothetical protein